VKNVLSPFRFIVNNNLSGSLPTEIGILLDLVNLFLGKYDGCLRCFHALFFIYKLIVHFL
jgi:hypothetical protein